MSVLDKFVYRLYATHVTFNAYWPLVLFMVFNFINNIKKHNKYKYPVFYQNAKKYAQRKLKSALSMEIFKTEIAKFVYMHKIANAPQFELTRTSNSCLYFIKQDQEYFDSKLKMFIKKTYWWYM